MLYLSSFRDRSMPRGWKAATLPLCRIQFLSLALEESGEVSVELQHTSLKHIGLTVINMSLMSYHQHVPQAVVVFVLFGGCFRTVSGNQQL